MVSRGFYVDSSRCTGCKTCVLACKDYHDLGIDNAYRKVYDYEGGSWAANEDGSYTQNVFMYHLSIACNHCNVPACTEVCPTGAMHKDDMSIVSVSTDRCIGCGYCTLACPYHAPHIDSKLKKSSKCNACEERLLEGRQPICVEACPLHALYFGKMSEISEYFNGGASIAPLPSGSYTSPNLAIRPSPAALPSGDREGFVANILEVEQF